jgi:hypothetical protein
MPRDARIDVEDLDHVMANIRPSAALCIATKEHTQLRTRREADIGVISEKEACGHNQTSESA